MREGALKNEQSGGTQWREAPALEESARGNSLFARAPLHTLLGSKAKLSILGIFSARPANKFQKACQTSGRAAVYRLRDGSIRKKIIGHGMRSILAGIARGKYIWRPRGAFSLLQKPAGQHGGGVFLHPLINQCRDFLAEIGCVSQTRQFKALQGVARSREKELPGRLGRARGHRASDKERCEH